MIGTLDTKRDEISYLAGAIVDAGGSPMLLDSSVSNGGAVTVDFPLITRAEVAAACGATIEEIASLQRGDAVGRMRDGVKEVTVALAAADRIDAAICIGGAGAHLAGPAFQQLEVGFPKMVVSPLASGRRRFEPYVGLRDVAVMHSVADIAGINEITERVFATAAGYIVGAAESRRRRMDAQVEPAQGEDTIAISMNGNTTKAMDQARRRLEAEGFAVVIFHANGVGGRALEDFVRNGTAYAVLDYTTTELGAGLVGGLMVAGPERMETAGRLGVPQVLVPGCVDFITCGRREVAEAEFPGRVMFAHNPELTLVRLTVEEMAELGAIFARKANSAVGPTSILVPCRGFSVPDTEGGPFWDPAADSAFIEALLATIDEKVRVEVLDAHINDSPFADAAVAELLRLIDVRGRQDGSRHLGQDTPLEGGRLPA